MSVPLFRLIIPNPHKKFRLEGRSVIFEGKTKTNDIRSLILKKGIVDGALEVFVRLIFLK
jgi:hypothetical protein